MRTLMIMRGNYNNNSRDHLVITHHGPSIFLLMLPCAVSVVEVTVLWREEVGHREGM